MCRATLFFRIFSSVCEISMSFPKGMCIDQISIPAESAANLVRVNNSVISASVLGFFVDMNPPVVISMQSITQNCSYRLWAND